MMNDSPMPVHCHSARLFVLDMLTFFIDSVRGVCERVNEIKEIENWFFFIIPEIRCPTYRISVYVHIPCRIAVAMCSYLLFPVHEAAR